MTQLLQISNELRTQDNRMTQNPMFCVQILQREVGFDTEFTNNQCWWNSEAMEAIYDDDPHFKEPTKAGWDGPYGYKDTWKTVMVAFTEAGCKQYLDLNGHNDRRQAFRGEVRIYVESFNRCPEMIEIRNALIAGSITRTP